MTVGERIKQRRLELGLSQDELAKKVGYKSRSSINKIELSRDLPLRKVREMAKVLDTSPSFLMGWDNTSEGKEKYYSSEETADKAQELFESKEMKLLFDAAKDSKPEDLQMAADLLKRLKGTNPDG